jgi:hypothetical protein
VAVWRRLLAAGEGVVRVGGGGVRAAAAGRKLAKPAEGFAAKWAGAKIMGSGVCRGGIRGTSG